MQKKIFALATGTVLALSLAACGNNGSELTDVEYSLNGATAEPSVSFATPYKATGTETHVIEEGQGEEIEAGDNVLIDATVFNGEDGSKVGSTYTQSPILISVSDQLKESAPELYDALTSAKVGTSFSYSSNIVASTDPSGNPTPSEAAKDSPTNVEVYTVKSKLLKTATGKELPEKDINSAIESFTLGEDGKAELKLAKDRGDAPTKLVTQDLITGEGEKVKDSDTLYVKYQGVRWEDGKVFDGNYDKEPIDLNLQGVIKGWTEGLKGKTVGSRVLLIIPEDMAYGKDAAEGAPTGSLVFTVDILGATDNPQAAAAAQSAAPSENESAKESDKATPSESAKSEDSASAQPSASESAQ